MRALEETLAAAHTWGRLVFDMGRWARNASRERPVSISGIASPWLVSLAARLGVSVYVDHCDTVTIFRSKCGTCGHVSTAQLTDIEMACSTSPDGAVARALLSVTTCCRGLP